MAKFVGEQALTELILKIKTSLQNYYTTSQVYTKTEVDSLVSAIPKFDIKVVSALPTTNISNSTIYLVTSGNETNNLYDEFVYANSGTEQNPTYSWEKLGTQTVDLSGYATTSAVNSAISSALASYYTKTETDTLLSYKATTNSVSNITSNTINIANGNGGFSAGNGASCSSNGAAVGGSTSATTGFAGGYNASATTGAAVGCGATATTGFAGGYNANATADGAVQLGTGTNATANTLKFRDKEIVRSDGKIESVNLRFETGVVSNSDLPVKSRHIYTALAAKQDSLTFDSTPTANSSNPVTSGGVATALSGKQNSMTEITSAEVDTLFDA